MPGHIQNAELKLSHLQITGLEVLGLHHFFHQFRGNGLPCFIVSGEGVEPFRFKGPVFHYLGRQFYKISGHVGSGLGRITSLGEYSVQCVAELVKEGNQFIVGQKRRS